MAQWLSAVCLLVSSLLCGANRVAVYVPEGVSSCIPLRGIAGELAKALGENKTVTVGELSPAALASCDVVILWGTQFKEGAQSAGLDTAPNGLEIGKKEAVALRRWVEAGGGVLCLHVANGLESKGDKPLFPEVASGIDNAHPDRQPNTREAVVTRAHPATAGLVPGERFVVSYFDFVTLAPGEKGTPLVRQVIPASNGGMVSNPVVVAGELGQGRVVACGFASGLLANGNQMEPLGVERQLLRGTVRWLLDGGQAASGTETPRQGENLGPRNLMPNLLQGTVKHLQAAGAERGVSDTERHEGRPSVYIKALDYTQSAGWKFFHADLGPAEWLQVKPNTVYILSFWMKTDAPYVVVHVAGKNWAALGNSLGYVRPADGAWHRYEGTFTTGPDSPLAWPCVGLSGRSEPWGSGNPALKLGTTLYLDDMAVFEQGPADSSADETDKVLVVKDKLDWRPSEGEAPRLDSTPAGSPLKFSERFQNAAPYSPLPDGWARVDLKAPWKLKMSCGVQDDKSDMPDGYWKRDCDDSSWPTKPTATSWYTFETRPLPWLGWYRTKFNLPASAAGSRALLKFEGVSYRCEIWLNGQRVGGHVGGYAGFSLDATAAAVFGGENQLAVRVFDPKPHHSIFPAGGIWGRAYVDIAPATYARRLLLTPRLEDSTLELDAWLESPKEQTLPLTAAVASCPGAFSSGPDYRQEQSLGALKLRPGTNRLSFKIKLDKPTLWTPENPFLYVLELKSGDGVLGKARFGFRSFVSKGPDFLLNGKPLFLRGLKFAFDAHYYRPSLIDPAGEGFPFMKRYLESRRLLNVNNLYTMGGPLPPAIYDLCDELGLTVYADAPTPRKDIPNELTGTDDLREMDEWVYETYNHPSQVMWSLGPELYGTDSKLLAPLYRRIHELDKQGRPVCASSGCRGEHETTDIWDFHAYPGGLSGSWPEEYGLISQSKADMLTRFAGKQMPVIQYEVAVTNRIYNVDNAMCQKAGFKAGNDWDKAAFLKIIFNSGGAWRCGLASMSTLYNQRLDLDCVAKGGRPGASQQRMMVNGLLGMARANGLLAGICPNQDTFDLVEVLMDGKLSPVRSFWPARKLDGPQGQRELVAPEIFDDFRRVYAPAAVIMPLFPKNNLAGWRFAADFYVVNNTGGRLGDLSVRAVLKTPEGKVFADVSAALGGLEDYKRLRAPLSIPLPDSLKAGEYSYELFLFNGGKRLSESRNQFLVMAKDAVADSLPTTKKVALFDLGDKTLGPGAMTTAKILAALKVPNQRIENFDALDQFDVLVIGAGSNGKALSDAAAPLHAWLERGGRLLSFEQSLPGALPFLPQISVVPGRSNVGTEIITLSHPAFKGLTPDNFFRWNGDAPGAGPGVLFKNGLKPLNMAMVAVSGADVPRNTIDVLSMTLADVRVGKGVATLSQLEATCRYGSDPAATKYVQNLLVYILSDETGYSTALDGYILQKPDTNRCGLVALGAKGVRKTLLGIPFDLPAQPLSADGKSLQIPLLQNEFFDPAFEKAYAAAHTDESGLCHDQAAKIYLLHGEADAKPGEVAGTYRLLYADGGASALLPVVGGVNIGAKGAETAPSGALDAGGGLFLTAWDNPEPGRRLKGLEVDCANGKSFIVQGVTCELVRGRLHQ